MNNQKKGIYENKDIEDVLIQLLLRSNNPEVCPIRTEFRNIEEHIIREHIVKDFDSHYYILYAGSGLGYELLKQPWNGLFSGQTVGLEKSKKLCELSKAYIAKKNAKNVSIVEGDFFKIPFADNYFDYSVLNSGTIGNFRDKQKKLLIEELLRVTNKCVMLDFYTPDSNQKRLNMYAEEGMGNTRLDGNTIRNDELGIFSEAMTLNKFDDLVASDGSRHREYVRIKDFGWMAKIYASRK